MEAIVRDGLPMSAYDFQFTLSNRTRPDCVIRLPGDERVMVVDAKFPLESLVALLLLIFIVVWTASGKKKNRR